MTPEKFYGDGFGMWIDFRSVDDNNIHGNGIKMEGKGDGIVVEMKRENGGKKKRSWIVMFMFL